MSCLRSLLCSRQGRASSAAPLRRSVLAVRRYEPCT
jgi:hypothetical protein